MRIRYTIGTQTSHSTDLLFSHEAQPSAIPFDVAPESHSAAPHG
jgi:hypothetical protein